MYFGALISHQEQIREGSKAQNIQYLAGWVRLWQLKLLLAIWDEGDGVW